jgi:hypothetical protein
MADTACDGEIDIAIFVQTPDEQNERRRSHSSEEAVLHMLDGFKGGRVTR